MAQLYKPQIQWTPDKISLLREEYPLGDKKLLAEKLGIKYTTLKDAARRFKVKSLTTLTKSQYTSLLSDCDEAYYWQGFIMGDGNISAKERLTITLAIKDDPHLRMLHNFIPGNMKYIELYTGYSNGNYVQYLQHDSITARKFLEKYKLTTNKTVNPPELSCLDTKDSFLSFFIGLFDADGCVDVRNGYPSALKIEVHANWKYNLEFIQDKLQYWFGIETSISYTSRGYIKLMIYKNNQFKILKKESIILGLPFMKRKWDKIDLSYTPKKYIIAESLSIIRDMILHGKTWKEIGEHLGVKPATCKRRYLCLTSKPTNDIM